MQQTRGLIREHRHFIVVVTLLTLVMTFPMIVYVFRTDVFALPTEGSVDVYIKLWDAWYSGQVITGKAERYFTELLYYPEGVSLASHTIFMLQGVIINALQSLIPLSNAFNLVHLLNVFSCALAAYIYLVWLFRDRWVALFGAVVLGFCPFVTGQPWWPNIAWIAPLPLIIYCFHHGVRERRPVLIILAGILTGLSHDASLNVYIVVLIALGLVVCALSASRWRETAYWRQVALLVAAVALSAAPRAIPLLQEAEALEQALEFYAWEEHNNDLISFFVNRRNPTLGPVADLIIQAPENAWVSDFSYLGIAPLLLSVCGLVGGAYRRKTLPWLGMCLVFVLLHLGPTLKVNGVEHEFILLPKHYLNQLLPFIFEAFNRPHFFMPGVCLALAVMSCFGLVQLRDWLPAAARPGFVLLLITIVAAEYYIPIRMTTVDSITGKPFTEERLAFVNWLKQEDADDIRLVNLPFGRRNAKLYMYYQTLTGYPQTEGGISRTPDSAYDYIRANPALNAWYERQPTNCAITGRSVYLSSLTQLANDGFSHVVHHRGFHYWDAILESFRYVDAAYSDDYVSIYRLTDLLESCPA